NPEDRETYQQILEQNGCVKDYAIEMKKRDGEKLIMLVTATAVCDEKGTVVVYRGIMRDVTEHKKLERQLLHAHKMEAVGQLSGGIAHDFNNILTAIMGYGGVLRTKISVDDPLSAYVDHILSASEKAAHLTQGLLAFSRRQILHPKPANLKEIIERVEKLLSRLIGEDIELKTIVTDKNLAIMADSGQIEQVLMNLATNARDAMPEGGQLTISTLSVQLDAKFMKEQNYDVKPGAYSLISVTDTGIGINEKTRRRIFEPFFTTKEVGKGTGLGLSMVYGIIKQHNGYINVDSESGKGATFNIYLPAVKAAFEETERTPIASPRGGTETVLLAEDDKGVRELMSVVLNGAGYKVIKAVDGDDAVIKFKENRDSIELVILDVVMPKKDGTVAYEEIRAIRSGVKTIFTSGYLGDVISKKRVLEKGTHFIPKPVSPKDLLRKTREALDDGAL
ncbi:MAG: response regulator, partial [Deltaproteobacteria bacterium]|nr:response regulator [Deltaproteobacteria bacterium]